MVNLVWRRIHAIARIKNTLIKLKERGLMYSHEKFISQIIQSEGITERTAKEYLKTAERELEWIKRT